MSTHANLSPSKRSRWALCPGSIREEAKYPEAGSGPAAIDGTHSHTLLEYCIQNNRFIDPMTQIGAKFEDHEGDFVVHQDRAERVKIAVDYIRERSMDGLFKVLSEERVDPEHLLGRKDLSGTVDCQIIGPDFLELIDYKDGMGVVSAEGNMQLEQYAYGVLAGYKLPVNGDYPIEYVKMTIIQPKLALRGMPAITSHTVTVKSLLDNMGTIITQAAATDKPDAPLVPGESQCKFCRAKGSCAALAGNVMKEVGIMFQPVVTETLDVAQQSADKDPATMDDQQIRQIMEAAPLMRQLLEAVEKEALRRLESGQSIPGLKLVNGRGSRAWALPEAEMAEKLVSLGVPKDFIYEKKLVTPAKAEKMIRVWWSRPMDQVIESLVRAKVPKRQITQQLLDDPSLLPIFTWTDRNGNGCSLTPRQVEMLMRELTEPVDSLLKRMDQEYVSKLAGKLTVVPESDSRPAVITNAAPMFSAVEAAPAAESLPSWLS